MKVVKCFKCGSPCQRYGRSKAGTQRWYCTTCKSSFSNIFDHTTNEFKLFQTWLFGKSTQKDMVGEGRNFRRKTTKFWEYWPMPPRIETSNNVVYVDGIYLARKACVLICCNSQYVLGWYVCRYENARAWEALMKRIATPVVVVSDGGSGFQRAVKKVWPKAKLQRCLFHVYCQVRRYTTTRSKSLAGFELYILAKDLLAIKDTNQALYWVQRLANWRVKHKDFLAEKTIDDNGTIHDKHERLLKAEWSLTRLIKNNTLFTYLDEDLDFLCPTTNNRIEGGINAQLRAMLRNHRGMSVERRIKAVFWWCYMHSEKPLSASEILKVMPTDKSISKLYNTMNSRERLEDSITSWGDAIVWSEFHHYTRSPDCFWD